MVPSVVPPRRSFSLVRGGPFYHFLVRLGLWTPAGAMRCWWLALLLWFPIALAVISGWPPDPSLLDLSVHVRLLFALPVFLLSERLLDRSTQHAIHSFLAGRFCDRARVERVLAGAERLRDAWQVEAALLAVALVAGQLALWGVVGSPSFRGRAIDAYRLLPRVWYLTIALPFMQFVMFRWLWRWLIWTRVLAKLARTPLALLPTHADLAGGLAPLVLPVTAFSGYVLALGAILSSAWGTSVFHGRTTIERLVPELAAFLVVSLAVAIGPLLVFSGHLFRARQRALARYGDLVREYTLRFHEKWIEPRFTREEMLGSSDMQSLNDLGQAYQVVSQSRPFVFGPRTILMVWLAGILPMLPLIASVVTVQELLKRILGIVIGGFPL